MQRFDGRHQVGDTGFVVQMAAADETIGDFHAWVKGHKITNLNAQRFGILRSMRDRIQAHFHGMIFAFGFHGGGRMHV